MTASEKNKRHKVVVIGGGYSGALAANHLRLGDDIDITLVNPRSEFVERVRLHQLAAGTRDATVGFDTILADDVRLVVDTATRIDTRARTVHLASGDTLDFDYAIYAVGSTGSIPSSVPGARDFAVSVAELESARRIRAALETLPQDAPITVVGGGLTGIETAAELAEQGHRVTLVGGGAIAASFSAASRRYISTWLERHHVWVFESEKVTEVRSDAVVLDDGTVRASALTIWTTGFGTPQLAAASGLTTDDLGRLLTDETLTSVDDDRIVATGDAAAPSGHPVRMSCQAAGPLGAQAADTVLSRVAGSEPKLLDVALTGSCVSLGRRAAVRQFAHKDDSSTNMSLTGPLGVAYKEFTSWFSVRRIRIESRRPGLLPWPKGGPRPQQAVRATRQNTAATNRA
ncbi:NAD(P)/FAD-dependent oxidoreductase [Humibacter sp. RRB41]|uniref:NAD(P)/FAD-dependent oxidoreductase n=1 Tax=Humibacter sp. RRB41 TaxID=2919946 RepID=UPI001FA9A853|nr:FAD-dependent oxidoreductase [Humibacter sp. RRB41]